VTIGGENQHRAAKDLAWQQATLEGLYERLAERVLRFFLRKGCTLEDARDLKQEVFLQVTRGLGTFRGKSELDTWVFGIAKNVWCNRVRTDTQRKRRAVVVPFEAPPASDAPALDPADARPSPLEAADQAQRRALIHRELLKMPKMTRQCTLLYMDQGMTPTDISKVLQIPVGTAKSHVSRAKKQLEELFSNPQDPKIPPEESP